MEIAFSLDKKKGNEKRCNGIPIIQVKAKEMFEEIKKQPPHSSHEETEFKVTAG